MKHVLITGADSYIGTNFENWLKQWPDEYTVDTVDTIGKEWGNIEFFKYDVVFHVAGIVHRKETPEMKQLYYDINCDLAVSVAKRAKENGVGQFIFMSTKGVYTPNTPVITKDTVPNPTKLYGKSKLQAERELTKLISENFIVAILRPPTVYGKGCPGNYKKLSRLAKKLPVFPDIASQRSMIYISNLCEFVRYTIDNRYSGILFPQNKEYVSSTIMVRQIAEAHGKRIRLSKLLGRFALVCMKKSARLRTLFSSSVYDKSLSGYGSYEYCTIDFNDSIVETES